MRRAEAAAVLASVFFLHGAAAQDRATTGPAALLEHVQVAHAERSVLVGLRDPDLVRRRFADLRLEVRLLTPDERVLDAFRLDMAHPALASAVPLEKRPGEAYAAVMLTAETGGGEAASRRLPLPPPVAPHIRVALTDETADLTPGAAFGAATAPAIRLADFSAAPRCAPGDPPRTVDIASARRRVVSDFNFPIAGSACFVSRQTAAPDDRERHSLYVPVNSDLYDPATGDYESTMKYLVEIPVDPAWVAEANDAVVEVPREALRIHMTTEELDVLVLGRQRITGSRKGLLGQTIHSSCVDEEGNIYFAMAYRSPIRFNIRRAKWEAPPVNIYEHYRPHAPAIERLGYPAGEISDVRMDFSNVIFLHDRRLYVSTTRYQIPPTGSGPNSLFLANVISIPTDHWDDPEAFVRAIRINAESYPQAQFPLWEASVQKNDERRKLNVMTGRGRRLCLLSYHGNAFWILDLAEDGSTQRLLRITHLENRPIAEFLPDMKWALRPPAEAGGQAGADEPLGLILRVVLEGEREPRTAFLPIQGSVPTDAVPEGATTVPYHSGRRGELHNSAGGYGRILVNKYNLARQTGRPWMGGTLTLHYDAIAALQANPGPYADIVARMAAGSMGPEYYVVGVPGDTTEVLGNADYPNYYFARYDCSKDPVRKRFLLRDMGDITARCGVPAGMGPYCHQWFREGPDDVLYYAGYTGIGRLVYAREGRPLQRHAAEVLTERLGHVCLDGAPDAFIKWFRDMAPGLDDKVFLTGVNQTERGGTAYSGGLMYFHRGVPDRLMKLSEMSRSHTTSAMAWRVRGAPGGRLAQQIFLKGNFSPSDAEPLPPEKRPTGVRPKVFVYEDRGEEEVRDRFGFPVAGRRPPTGGQDADGVSLQDLLAADNGLHLLLLTSDGVLITFDVDGWRFVDAVRLSSAMASFDLSRRGNVLLRTPDGGQMICVYDPPSAAPTPERAGEEDAAASPRSARFLRIEVGLDGSIRLTPHLRCRFADPVRFTGPAAFLYDAVEDDGSYDLVIGPNSRAPEGALRILRDFVPPRRAGRTAG